MPQNQLPLFSPTIQQARAAGQVGMALVEQKAGEEFAARAAEFIVAFLGTNGPATGEDMSDAAMAAGIIPHNSKAFGPVIAMLARDRTIEKCGSKPRRKGHGTAGANVWRLIRGTGSPAHGAP